MSIGLPPTKQVQDTDGANRYGAAPLNQPWLGRLRYVVVPILAVLAIATVTYLLSDRSSEPDAAVGESANAVASGSARPVNVTGSAEELARVPAPRVGYPAPEFALNGIDGKTVRLSDFRGQAVFLNFFATWCPPCRAEMPDILATYEENKTAGAVVVAIDLQEDQVTVRNYVETVGLTFPVVLDRSGRVAGLYRLTALPSSYFVDKDGVIRDMQIGAMSRSIMQKRLEKALQAGGK